MDVPIEDAFEDVLRKAAVGQRLGSTALALRAKLSLKEVRSLLAGNFIESHLRKVAPLVGLDADKLVALAKAEWRPAPVVVEGLQLFHMAFPDASYPDATVNCYLVYDPATKDAIAFDSGTEASPMLEFIEAHGLRLQAIFLTHTHRDHVGGFEGLLASAKSGRVFAPAGEPYPKASRLEVGATVCIGSFEVRSVLTNGHSKGALSYLVSGLSRPVAFVGDALFSLSMGGAMRGYKLALSNNREKLLSLAPDTILCPGHGPMTTVAEELEHNPFF